MYLEHELSSLLRGCLSPIKLSFFREIGQNGEFECSTSNNPRYPQGEIFSLYELTPLLRVLSLKENFLSEQVFKEALSLEEKMLCYIVDWGIENKKVLFLSLDKLAYLDEEKLVKTLTQNESDLKRIF